MFKLKLNLRHFVFLVKQYISILFSDKLSLITMLLEAPVMVFLIQLTCAKDFSYYNAMMTLFVIVIIIIIMSILSSYQVVSKEREILKREISSGLDTNAYILSKIAVQAIIALIQTIIIVSGVLSFIDIPLTVEQGVSNGSYRVFMIYLICFMIYMTSVSLGILISAVLKNSDSAVLPVLFIIISQVVLSGALMDLPSSITWLSTITIAKWGLGALGGVVDMNGLFTSMYPKEVFSTPPEAIRQIYTTDFGWSMVMLVVIFVVCVGLSMVFVKRSVKK